MNIILSFDREWYHHKSFERKWTEKNWVLNQLLSAFELNKLILVKQYLWFNYYFLDPLYPTWKGGFMSFRFLLSLLHFLSALDLTIILQKHFCKVLSKGFNLASWVKCWNKSNDVLLKLLLIRTAHPCPMVPFRIQC